MRAIRPSTQPWICPTRARIQWFSSAARPAAPSSGSRCQTQRTTTEWFLPTVWGGGAKRRRGRIRKCMRGPSFGPSLFAFGLGRAVAIEREGAAAVAAADAVLEEAPATERQPDHRDVRGGVIESRRLRRTRLTVPVRPLG